MKYVSMNKGEVMDMKRIVFLILIIMLLITTAVSCVPKSESRTSDLGVSRGNLVSSDGWVYYSRADGLHKIRPDGNDKTLVLDTCPLIFSIYEDRIYYVPYDEIKNHYIPDEEEVVTVYSIYSCNTDGSNNKFICEIPRALPSRGRMQMRIVDGWIYVGLRYDSGTGYDLYRMKVDGTGMTMITPWNELFDYSIDDDGWIYYMTSGEFEGSLGGQLWRMRHDGTEKQQLMQEVSWAIDYTETEIYYIDMSENNFYGDIYAISRKGPKKRKVAECEAESTYSFLKVIGDWVYYLDDGVFYKVRTDGSGLTEIPSFLLSDSKITVVDNWLTYRSKDFKYLEMVRISDMYDTDDLYDLIFEDQLESALRDLDMDDPIDQRLAERYENYETRKYE